MTAEDRMEIERKTRGQGENIEWFRARKGRITASLAKDCCGKGNPVVKVKKILTMNKPGRTRSVHMQYGIENEDMAVQKFVQQMIHSGHSCSVNECGPFVEEGSGILAATPDRLATIDGEKVVLEVKCLSASRELTPLAAVTDRQKQSSFGFSLKDGQIILKKKHKYFYQVQMQMALTFTQKCYLIIFTNSKFSVEILNVAYEEPFWKNIREQLLRFHSTHVLPALIEQRFPHHT